MHLVLPIWLAGELGEKTEKKTADYVIWRYDRGVCIIGMDGIV
jgi:hypothetical protein